MSTATASASSKLHTTSLSQTSATQLPQITGAQKDEIINAIVASNLDLLKKIVSPDIVNLKDRSGNTLLHLATNSERTTVAKWLVSIGADVNAHCNGHTVLSSALNKANYELFDFYLAHKAECIGRNQLNLVHEAVQQQRADIVDRLISLGADPNLYNSVHVTPLTIACAHRNLEICLILMENGACANLPDKKGNTALHVACGTADTALIDCLIKNTECDLRLKNSAEETPLDLLFLAYLRDNKLPDVSLLERLIKTNGALFSMPWNFTLTQTNAPVLIIFCAHLCKLVPRLNHLFLNDKPFFTDLILRGYWRNSLLIAIRSCIVETHSKTNSASSPSSPSSPTSLVDLLNAIDLITLTNQFGLIGADLLSTLYSCEDFQDEFEVYKHVKQLYGSLPLSLRNLCRNEIRSSVEHLDEESFKRLGLNEVMCKFLSLDTLQLATAANAATTNNLTTK